MKKVRGLLLGACLALTGVTAAQSQEAQQLMLDVEKLARFKAILSEMEQGYHQLWTAYENVRRLAQGNFSLHKTFLDSLLLVSEGVKTYYRVAEILARERQIVRGCGDALAELRGSGQFSAGELHYLSGVYGRLLSGCTQNLQDLATVLTPGKLRMNDGARLTAIDGIEADLMAAYRFAVRFNRQNRLAAQQRRSAQHDIDGLKTYYHDIHR